MKDKEVKNESEDKDKIGFLVKTLSLPKSQIVKLLGNGDIKYTLDNNNNITELTIISAIYINGKGLDGRLFNNINLPTTKLQELRVFSFSYDYDWNHVDGWWKSDFKDLQENIGELKNLEVLKLSGNSITTLPESIGDLKNLKKLYLDCNDIENLPKTITKLNKLEKLTLSDNPLSNLPTEMTNLTNLKSLTIAEKQMFSFAKFGTNLSNLEELIIYPIFPHRTLGLKEIKNYDHLPDSIQDCFKELMSRGCRIKLYG